MALAVPTYLQNEFKRLPEQAAVKPRTPETMNAVRHYLFMNGEQKGPYTIGQLQTMWRNGTITSETRHFMDGYSEWMPLEIIVPDLDPPLPVRAYPPAVLVKPVTMTKSRGIYVILGLFLGGPLGVHNFYAGRFGTGVCQLLVTVLTGWLILPLLAVSLWVIVELCVVTKDGNGVKMT
jgi:TM2 domain-containing membrane protein YozV